MIRLTEIRLNEHAEKLVLDVLRSGQLAQGPLVQQFEKEFATISGTVEAIAVSNGTVSLETIVRALNIGPGDEVIIPSFTFVATLNAVLHSGATVRFADISLETFTIDPEHVKSLITDRTKAIIPVHLYGQMADMRALSSLVKESPISLIEDSAQAHGATFEGKPAGSWGIGSFSFYATKNMTTGEGGMITTSDQNLANFVRLFRNQGMQSRYQYEIAGSNQRMTDLQAAIGLSQVPYISEWSNRRRRNARYLSESLDGVPGIVTPFERPGSDHVFHQYTIRVTPEARITRDTLSMSLAQKEIQSGIYYPKTVYDYDCFREISRIDIGDSPKSETAALEVLSLPVHQWLSESDLDQIVSVLSEALN